MPRSAPPDGRTAGQGVPKQAAAPPATPSVRAVTAPNAVILEGLGNGVLYSINYERAFTSHIGARAGIMHAQSGGDTFDGNHFGNHLTVVPIMVHYLTGNGRNHFELGAGAVLGRGHWQFDTPPEGTSSNDGSGVFGTMTIGYRHQAPESRNIFRVGLTPFFDTGGGFPWFGISYGRRW